jgi:hypothetical protein
MANVARALHRKDITGLARETWSKIWGDPMPAGWRVHLVRKTVIQRPFGREVCGVILRHTQTILIGRHTGRPSFRTLVHELAHLRTLDEARDHGPRWRHEFYEVARSAFGSELERNI